MKPVWPENFPEGGPSVRFVTTPYRNDAEALRERKENLEREIARLRDEASGLEGIRAREKELERELASVAERLGGGQRRALPLLDQVRVASPCSANWDEMIGDSRVRFCLSCEKNVYNLSAMPRDEAERLLEERAGKEMCVRFYQRADGTILTEDCPVGVKKKRRKKLALAVAGAGAMAAAAATTMFRGACHTQGEMALQGAMPVPTTVETATPVMGQETVPTPPPTPVPSTTEKPITPKPVSKMGKPVLMGARR